MAERIIEATSPRILPVLTDVNRPFWTGGAQGELLIQRCATCARWIHPPTACCAVCDGVLEFAPVSGAGTLFTFTVNFQQFHPDVAPPYVVAIVELDEQDDLRIPTNIVNCDVETLQCGMPVRVLFEPNGDVFVPVFEPTSLA